MGTNTHIHTQAHERQSVMMKNHTIVRFYVLFKYFILYIAYILFSFCVQISIMSDGCSETHQTDAYFHVASLFVYLNCLTFFK